MSRIMIVAACLLLAAAARPQDEAPAPELVIELVDEPALRLAVSDATGSYAKHAQVIGGLYMQLGMAGIEPRGRLIGIYPDDPAEIEESKLRWSVALRIDDTETPGKPLRLLELPAMQVASYETTLARVSDWDDDVAKWIDAQGLTATGVTRMEYLTDGPGDPEKMRVRVIIPVGAAGAFSLADVAFIAGEWHGRAGEARLIERWSEPMGDSMLGAFQWVRPEGVWMYELMTIQQRDDDVLFQLRHFDRDMKPWEDPESPVRMKLVEVAAARAVFQNLDEADDLDRMVFTRKSDDRLEITLVNRGAGGDSTFGFVRAE